MTGEWPSSKFQPAWEMEFPSGADSAINTPVGQPNETSGSGSSSHVSTANESPWQSVLSARADEVKRARQLLQDPDYPSKKTLDAVAELLAQHLDPSPTATTEASQAGQSINSQNDSKLKSGSASSTSTKNRSRNGKSPDRE